MATKLKRVTLVITPSIQKSLDYVKKEMFYNTTQSEMIRALIEYGLEVIMPECELENK